MLKQIDKSSYQQNDITQHINREINQLDAFTQSSAAQAEESAGAIAEMQKQSQTILENVEVLEAMFYSKGQTRSQSSSASAIFMPSTKESPISQDFQSNPIPPTVSFSESDFSRR